MSLSVVNKQQRAGRWSCKGVQPAPAESCRHSGIWISFCTGWFHSGKLFVYCIVTYNAYTERCNVQIVIRCAVVESNARQKIEPCPTPEPPAYPLSLKATFPPSVVNDPFTFIAIIFLLSIILFPPKCELLNTTAWLSRFLNLNEIVLCINLGLASFAKYYWYRGTWLTQREERVTLISGTVSSSPMLHTEIT